MNIFERCPSNAHITKVTDEVLGHLDPQYQNWEVLDRVISGTGFYADETFATRDGYFVNELDMAGQLTGRTQIIGPRQYAEEFTEVATTTTPPAQPQDLLRVVAAANKVADELGLTAYLAEASDDEREYAAAFIRLPLLSEVRQVFINATAMYGQTNQAAMIGALTQHVIDHPGTRAFNSHPGVPVWHGGVVSPSPVEAVPDSEAREPEPEYSLGGIVWFDGTDFSDLSTNPDGTLSSNISA